MFFAIIGIYRAFGNTSFAMTVVALCVSWCQLCEHALLFVVLALGQRGLREVISAAARGCLPDLDWPLGLPLLQEARALCERRPFSRVRACCARYLFSGGGQEGSAREAPA